MKTLSFFMLSVFPLLLFAQTNTEINARIKGLKAGEWIYCYEPDGTFKDSVKSTAGGFHFKFNIPKGNGNVYSLQIGNEYAQENSMYMYLDEGTVKITGNGPGFTNAKASGTASVDDYNAYKNFIKNDSSQKALNALYKKGDELYNKHDSIGLDALRLQIEAADSIKAIAVSKWLINHPNSAVDPFIIYSEINGIVKMPEIEALMNKLSDKAKDNMPGKKLLHSIEAYKLTSIGKVAPDFIQNDSTGKPVSLKDFRGKYVLIDFWASWCGPCREENSNVVKAYSTYKDKNFTILSISFDDKKENWLKAIQKDGLAWNHVSDLKGWQNAVGQTYDIEAIPANILIDPTGTIIGKDLMGDKLENKLAEVLKN